MKGTGNQREVMLQAAKEHLRQHPEAKDGLRLLPDGTFESRNQAGTALISAVGNSTQRQPDDGEAWGALSEALSITED